MFQVKIFATPIRGNDFASLEHKINDWLEAAQPAIRQMTQSGSGERIVVTFLYEKRRGEDQAHVATADVPEAFERDLEDTGLDPVGDEPTVLPEAELPY
jgi:hypothetical protein